MSPAPKDNKMKTTVELVRRGASILAEPCPTCGGVQIKYHGRTFCTSHADLSPLLSQEEVSYDAVVASLRQLLLSKLAEGIRMLEQEKDSTKQDQLVSLMTKYFDLLEKLPVKA